MHKNLVVNTIWLIAVLMYMPISLYAAAYLPQGWEVQQMCKDLGLIKRDGGVASTQEEIEHYTLRELHRAQEALALLRMPKPDACQYKDAHCAIDKVYLLGAFEAVPAANKSALDTLPFLFPPEIPTALIKICVEYAPYPTHFSADDLEDIVKHDYLQGKPISLLSLIKKFTLGDVAKAYQSAMNDDLNNDDLNLEILSKKLAAVQGELLRSSDNVSNELNSCNRLSSGSGARAFISQLMDE